MGNILTNNKSEIPENQLIIIIELLKTKLNELEISNKQLTEQFIVERTKYQRQVKNLENKLEQLESKGKINVNVEDINKSVDIGLIYNFKLRDSNINYYAVTENLYNYWGLF